MNTFRHILCRGLKKFPAAMALPLVALAFLPWAEAQIPDTFTNLKVLPGETGKGELMGVMRGFAGSLGVRCNHCHVGPDNLQGMDFATDEKQTKRTARAMMIMVNDINGKYLAGLKPDRTVELEVQCATCHRSQAMPRFIQDVVEQAIASDGLEGALARYRELREEHYGGFAYDFSAGPLSSLGEKMAAAGKITEALAVLELNSSFHPDSIWNRVLTAQVHARSGDLEKAKALLEKVLEDEEDNGFVKMQLESVNAAIRDRDSES